MLHITPCLFQKYSCPSPRFLNESPEPKQKTVCPECLSLDSSHKAQITKKKHRTASKRKHHNGYIQSKGWKKSSAVIFPHSNRHTQKQTLKKQQTTSCNFCKNPVKPDQMQFSVSFFSSGSRCENRKPCQPQHQTDTHHNNHRNQPARIFFIIAAADCQLIFNRIRGVHTDCKNAIRKSLRSCSLHKVLPLPQIGVHRCLTLGKFWLDNHISTHFPDGSQCCLVCFVRSIVFLICINFPVFLIYIQIRQICISLCILFQFAAKNRIGHLLQCKIQRLIGFLQSSVPIRIFINNIQNTVCTVRCVFFLNASSGK